MYTALRAFVRFGLHLYCGRIHVEPGTAIDAGSPVLLASNHPNSFFDALVVATHLPQHMRFLARGDAFHDPLAARILRALFMIPVYRMSEGRDELRHTEESFGQAQADLEQGGSVLVFSEGLSMNAPGLRPLGKGTARIAARAWNGAAPEVQVLPTWLRYGTFRGPFKEVRISTGAPMASSMFDQMHEAAFLRSFNEVLRERLIGLSLRSDEAHDLDSVAKRNERSLLLRALLVVPAFAGLVLHAPWYFSLRSFTAWKTRGSVFFDSVLFGSLLLTYPLWLAVLVLVGVAAGLGVWAACVMVIAPLLLAALRRLCIG